VREGGGGRKEKDTIRAFGLSFREIHPFKSNPSFLARRELVPGRFSPSLTFHVRIVNEYPFALSDRGVARNRHEGSLAFK
jgi:hypothetical protein